jgi:hypothetical protein
MNILNNRDLEFEGEDEQKESPSEDPPVGTADNGSSSRDTTEIADTTTGDTIAKSLSRKRSQTNTLLQETSDAALLAQDGNPAKKTRAIGLPPPPRGQEEDGEFEEEIVEDLAHMSARVDVETAADIDFTSDFLGKSKIKATQDSIPVPEIAKLVTHKTRGGESYDTLCENLFTMICCLTVERVTTCGLTLNEEAKLALYHQYYFEAIRVCTLDSYLHDNLFKEAPTVFTRDKEGNLEWPQFYMDYVRDKYLEKGYARTEVNRSRKYQKLNEAERKKYYFTMAIKNAHEEAKREINNRYLLSLSFTINFIHSYSSLSTTD